MAAAAIAENKRGELVGEKTFGEGAQQKTFDLPDGGAIILSVAKYESPSGKAFQSEGITPTVVVASNFEETPPATDESGSEGHPAVATQKRSAQADDQLNKALEILKNKTAA